MANTALRHARKRAHLSQDAIAREIREYGLRTGEPNGCNRNTYQRWEAGKVRPQDHYLLALENVLGKPATELGFADVSLGVDRVRALADAGMNQPFALPGPREQYGEMTGIWLSSYDYESSSRAATYTSKHHVMLWQRGARLSVRALPHSASAVSMDLSANGQVVTGTWVEETERGGYYSGATYHGAIQMLAEPTGRRMKGMWVGFGRDMTVNTGPWSLTLVDDGVDQAAVDRWDREPG